MRSSRIGNYMYDVQKVLYLAQNVRLQCKLCLLFFITILSPPPHTHTHTAPLFYSHMKTYLLSEDQLRDNGYPRPTSRLGEATIHRGEASTSQANEIRTVGPNAMEHRCCRCGKRFIIYNSGQYQRVEECIYHYGRLFKNKGGWS